MKAIVKLQGCTNFKLRRLTRVVSRHYDSHVASSGLKTTQYSLLTHVIRLGSLRPVDLALAMSVDASTLTRNLKPLLRAGWLTQSEGPDARSRLIAVTEAGRVKQAEAKQLWRAAQLGLNKLLGPDRVAALHLLIDESLALLGGQAMAEAEG